MIIAKIPALQGQTSLIQGINYQLFWFIFLFHASASAATQILWIGMSLLSHFLLISQHRRRDLIAGFSFVAWGLLIDHIFFYTQTLQLNHDHFPLWLSGMWFHFGLCFFYALSWLISRPIMFVTLMGVFGPLAYYAGVKFAIWNWSEPFYLSFLFLSLGWMITAVATLKFNSIFIKKFSSEQKLPH